MYWRGLEKKNPIDIGFLIHDFIQFDVLVFLKIDFKLNEFIIILYLEKPKQLHMKENLYKLQV